MAGLAMADAVSGRGAVDRQINLVEARPDLVRATVDWGAADLSAGGLLAPAAVVAVADALCTTGARLTFAQGEVLLALDIAARLLTRTMPRRVNATAQRLHHSAAALAWSVTFMGVSPGSALVATVSQTQIVENGPSAHGISAEPPHTDQASQTMEGPRYGSAATGASAAGRRDRIASAAADIIGRKGFAGASIREIADAAGLHVPTLYQSVTSKDELLELIYSGTMAALQADLEAGVRGCHTAEQRLRTVIAVLVQRGDRFRHQIGILNRELRSLSPMARDRVIAQYRALLAQIAAVVEAGIAGGEFRATEPALVANLINAACDVWPLRQFSVKGFGAVAFERETAEFILRGLLRDV